MKLLSLFEAQAQKKSDSTTDTEVDKEVSNEVETTPTESEPEENLPLIEGLDNELLHELQTNLISPKTIQGEISFLESYLKTHPNQKDELRLATFEYYLKHLKS